MPKCLFLSSIPFDKAVLSVASTDEISSLPVTNLQFIEPERKWRSTNRTNPRVVIQMPEDRVVNAVAAIAHNGSSTAQWKIEVGLTKDSVTGVSAPIATTGIISMWPAAGKPTGDEAEGYANLRSLALVSNTQLVRWVSVTFYDSTNTDLFFEVGRLMIDFALRPKVDVGGEIKLQAISKNEARRGDFNRVRTDWRGPNCRRMTLPFNSINKENFRKDFFSWQLRHGPNLDFFFCVDPENSPDFQIYSMQALLVGASEFERKLAYDADGGVWKADLIIEEVL